MQNDKDKIGGKLRVGMGQMLVEGGEPQRNLDRAIEMVKNASENQCDILLLPEALDLGWTHPSAQDEALPIPGAYSDQLSKAAKDYGIYICGGLTEQEGDKVYNSAILIDSQGEILLKYRKINVLAVAFDYYSIGDRLGVVDTPFGRIGVNICSDNYSDSLEIGNVLARMGAQIILSPCAWTSDYHYVEGEDPYSDKWTGPYMELSKAFNILVVGCTSVGYIVGGPYEGKKMIGCSIAVDATGVVVQGQYNEFAGRLTVADVNVPNNQKKGTEIGEMLKGL